MSALRARCPHCRTLTAVAFDEEYECHSCGTSFAAGLVRVPRAWGSGGEAMADAARIAVPYPEALVVVRGKEKHVHAETVSGAPRDLLWNAAVTSFGGYAGYQMRAEREIPVVRLRPIDRV